MTQEQWLEYLRKHPGTYAAAWLLYDTITKQRSKDAVENISNLLIAFGRRVEELK
jgi:hypothetical protein